MKKAGRGGRFEDIRIQSILVGLENSGLTTERYDLFANPDEFESNVTLKALMDRGP